MGRNLALDRAKLAMALMVVAVHGRFLNEISPELSWQLVNGLFRIAVPGFLLINGHFFHDALAAGRAGRWMGRVLRLYLCWFGLYLALWQVLPDSAPAQLLPALLLGPEHLWYLPGSLCGAALLWALRARPRWMAGLAILAWALGVALEYAGDFGLLQGVLAADAAHRNGLLLGFPMMALGYLLRRAKPAVPGAVALAAGLAGLLVMQLEAALMPLHDGYAASVDNFIGAPLAVAGLFLALARLPGTGPRGAQLSRLATGVYLSHLGIMEALRLTALHSTPLTLLTALLALTAAAGLVALDRRLGPARGWLL